VAVANNIFFLNAFPQGTSPAAAVTQKLELGIVNYQMGILRGWVYWYDQANVQVRLMPPTATIGGLIATLPPWASPLNIPLQDILGTEDTNPYTGNYGVSLSDLAALEQAGIMVITNPIAGYASYGLRNSQNSIGNKQPNSVVEYSRMTNYLVESNAILLGPFVGKLQGASSSDPLRANVRNALNTFYSQLATQGFIQGAAVICNTSNNTQQSIASFALYVSEQVTYMASVLDILATIQGGVTVQFSANPLGPSLSTTQTFALAA
jgi:phage tail sheath protein FI